MTVGPGKYDAVCTSVFEITRARAAIVIVFDGAAGTGFSVTSEGGLVLDIPKVLRNVADQIEADTQ